MTQHTITFALEVTAVIEAPSRQAALLQLRKCRSADLWERFTDALAETGAPAEGVQDTAIRFIGRPA